jgi:hypothetical protein
MKIIKHFIKVLGYYSNRLFCKHTDNRVASCPFTGYTYTTCNRCAKRLNIVRTPMQNINALSEENNGKA